ncbi:hypothetical protein [Streptomyces sp. NBC_00094]|uniref:hypothetical protein n=1 Tax=Streptomyces sp. NBC_00094 TaxID=2903620 RepID=UPI002259DA9D|nr:hypothetical protein [Streptomyces sp. NBC_00094]MCX5392986.1 hypothetical protein [Streptomyces sp. NBC_00094]
MTVTRPARLTGAALCAALALLAAVWILKDLAALGSPAGLAWSWSGDHYLPARGPAVTSLVDPLLLAVSVATAVAALRSRHAASALVATGVVTLALRLPGLWALGTGALVTALLDVALAAGLVITAAAGRRRADRPHEQLPTRPRAGRAVAAGILLAVAALTVVLWEAHWAGELRLQLTVDRFVGGRSAFTPVLAPPPAWLSLVLVGLYGAAAVSAFARARHTRAFGLLAGAFLTACGFAAFARVVRVGLLPHLTDAPTFEQLYVLTAAFGLFGGIAVLALLAGRGAPVAAPAPYGPYGSYGPPPAPPYPPPPGW